ncbi:MAG: phage tail tape measure protein [Desulfobulbaceae bacterium]|jgi:TP901 family phage tail tape measure protein|nr:phage tail tape measure protein [Desulfobulbaceae bacterium]
MAASSKDISLSISIDPREVKSGFAEVQAAYEALTAKLSGKSASLDAFAGLKKSVGETAKAYAAARGELEKTSQALKAMQTAPAFGSKSAWSKDLQRDFEAARKKADDLKRSLRGQGADLKAMAAQMKAAGQNVSGLAGQYEKLKNAQRNAQKGYSQTGNIAAARQALDVRPFKEITAAIERQRAAYAMLKSSGKVSIAELAQAHIHMKDNIAALEHQTNGWRQSLQKSWVEMTAKAAGAIQAFVGLRAAATAAIDFEDAMVNVQKVTETTREQFRQLTDGIIKGMADLPQSAVELAKIMEIGGQMGLPVDDLQQFTRLVAKMAVTMDMTAEEAGKAFGKLQGIFHTPMREMSLFGDLINTLGSNLKTNEKDIVEAMTRIGSTTNTFGLAKEQAAALAAAMLDIGKTPEVAATGLNAFMTKLQTAEAQTPKFQAALQKIGLSAEQMGKMVAEKPQEAINLLLGKLAELDNRQKSIVMLELFGQEYVDDVAALVNGLDRYKLALKLAGDQAKYAGSQQTEFDRKMAATKQGLTLFTKAWERVKISLGNAFLPLIDSAARWAAAMMNAFATVLDAAKNASAAITVALGIGGIGKIIAAGAPYLKLMFANTFSGSAAAGVAAMIAQFSGLGAGLLFTVKGLLSGVTALIIGWDFGKMLTDKFLGFEQAGIRVAVGFNRIMLMLQRTKAHFTDWSPFTGISDKARAEIAEIDRLLEQNNQIFAEMWQEATRRHGESVDGRVAKESQGTNKITQENMKMGAAMRQSIEESVRAWEIANGRITNAAKAAADNTRAQWQGLVAEVQRLQGEIAGRQQTLQQKLREMGRSDMSGVSAWVDMREEAAEYYEVALKAFNAGDFDKAREYADQAVGMYEKLNHVVEHNGQTVLTQTQAEEKAMQGVKAAGELAIKSLEMQREAANGVADAISNKFSADSLMEGMSAAEKKWITSWKEMRTKAIEDIDNVQQRLNSLRDKTVYVNVIERTKKRWGGLVRAFRDGGMAEPLRLALGAKLPGYGGGDRIPALLEAGEFVIRKEAVAKFGQGLFQSLNNLRFPSANVNIPRLSAGGPLERAGGGEMTINLAFPQGKTVTVRGEKTSAEELLRQLARMRQLSSA